MTPEIDLRFKALEDKVKNLSLEIQQLKHLVKYLERENQRRKSDVHSISQKV